MVPHAAPSLCRVRVHAHSGLRPAKPTFGGDSLWREVPLSAHVAGCNVRALTYWLLVRGRADRPLPRHVDAAAIAAHGSSRRPAVEPGDLAVLYAAVWQALYGVVEVVSVPEHDPSRERWAWRFAIRP